ncbi:hypothetical protein N7539_009556 [Penicillium diatomitis]|uniref:CENP-V/GFA domain-containing protein n=1 Tax=Penicillium diatomitis TaxID=2819901 RepID=A0A9X0BIZ7_9EURO|nr:uncharacterized protein N7539_009556 [Penicillium diatomitis]KAJ5466600.1 hypothetical protein N7539_009556 [Penicillium diatomitis]
MAEMGESLGEAPLPNPAFTNNNHEHTLKEESWKHRAPYRSLSDEEFGPIKWRGKCKCGNITFSIRREKPVNAKYCHCRGCQVMHGAPFQWAAIFHKEDVNFSRGCSDLAFYSSSGNTQQYQMPTKVSCSFCHTLIMDEGRNMCLLFPQLIELEGSSDEQREQRNIFKPTCHIFYEQRMIDIPDGIDKWSGMDGHSERLDDQGNPLKH